MSQPLTVVYGDAIRDSEPWLPFGCATVEEVSAQDLEKILAAARQRFPAHLEQAASRIDRRIASFDAFFRSRGFRCPLPAQMDKVRRRGLPRFQPFVDALLLCEMSTGLLMGVQDRGRIEGRLVVDLASEGETLQGMRGEVRCRAGEIVLKDGAGIIASYFQGPDRRTRVTPATRDLVFFAFAAPGISAAELREALDRAVQLFQPASGRHELLVLEPD